MLDEQQFLAEVWERLSSEISDSRYSNRELSNLCGRGQNFINTAAKSRSEIGIYAFYAICERLSLDASAILGTSDKVVITERAHGSEADMIDALLQAARKVVRSREEANARPTLDQILISWRDAEQKIGGMDITILSYCDVYAPPNEDGVLKIQKIGKNSLTAEVLQSTDVDIMNRNLANSAPDISQKAASIQREALDRQYVMTIKTLDTPLLNGKRLSIVYDQLNLLVFDKRGEAQILVYPKYVSQL